jgi:uncharacterized protein (DUF2141 family)
VARLARWTILGLFAAGGLACTAMWPRGPSSRREVASALASAPETQPASKTLPASAPSGPLLTVTVKDLRNRKGRLIFGVFKSADGYPNVEAKSVYWELKDADASAVTFTTHLPTGRYAASVLHDENRSGDMDRNIAGIPTEGYGVTNNPKPALRAATFREATFNLPPEGKALTISLQYF